MSKILWCIVGETASGKDSVARHLQEKYGMKIVCSYTTRPPRAGETDGIEHWFVSNEKMKELMQGDNIVAYTKIEDKNSNTKGYEYCATLDNVNDADIYIIDPKGIEYMKEEFPQINIKSIFIHCNEDIRRERALGRDSSQRDAFEARVANERCQFEKFLSSKGYDYLVVNEGKTLEQLFSEVDRIIEGNLNL